MLDYVRFVRVINFHIIIIIMTGDVDAQLHGCLLSIGQDQNSVAAEVTHHLTNFAEATGVAFTRRENNISADSVPRQSMVNAQCRIEQPPSEA